MTTSPQPRTVSDDRVAELLRIYGDSGASLGWLLCDRHPEDARAYTVVGENLAEEFLTYGELREGSERFAAALTALGVAPGDRVATLMGKSADYLTAVMGIWRLGAVHVPLFTAFAPPAIAVRLQGSATKVVVCDEGQLPKLAIGEDMPDNPPWTVVVSRRVDSGGPTSGQDLDFGQLIAQHEPGFPAAALGGDAPIVHIYTSGTTGNPKGVVLPTLALASMQVYMEFGLDVDVTDSYWCAADPGWAYGLYYAVLGPLTIGVPSMLLNAGFSPELTWQVLSKYQVTNFAAAPTVYRALRASGRTPPNDLRVRCLSSAGEPLTPDINAWARTALGVVVHDHYGQTEAGMLINNHHHPALLAAPKVGSMGRPMPGWKIDILDQETAMVLEPGRRGRIAVDMTDSPLAWFSGYHDSPDATASKFAGDGRWYLTGDAGHVDIDGDFHFMSRDDDVIIMAGYRIGPFEVESVLVDHPDVIEAAAIAVADEIRGEVIEAHVVLRHGAAPSAELAANLQDLVKVKLAAHAYPRQIHFVGSLPKTPSGKIQRFVLRQRRREEVESGKR